MNTKSNGWIGYMTKQDLDEFIKDYGFDNRTDIDDQDLAMLITKLREDKKRK